VRGLIRISNAACASSAHACRADVAVAVNDGDEYARDAVFIFCARTCTHAAAAAAAADDDDDDDVAAR